ncbi:MAG: MBOAT family O-acyltransferase [Oscillospiraceae bacterium]
MVFSSTLFIFLFLPAVLLTYYISPRKIRNGILLVFSLLFYSWGEPVYILIMLFSTVFDYMNGILIRRLKDRKKNRQAKAVMINSVIINLGILCFFKYSNFFIGNINALFHTGFAFLDITLPIGISFYTFQTMSYTIDIYRGDAEAQKNIIDFGAYVTMFPQLVAGPIVQYKDIAVQLNSRAETIDGFTYGIKRFIIGLAKKVILANNIGLLWEQISRGNLGALSVSTAWLGAIAFSFQIYFDFSGYSDMAIGLGEMFGFHFRENFNLPYRSKSITEFWRRWHISLGTWFREYVYIPLGGSRKGTARLVLNLLIVWSLTGFWHGSSWNFIFWGLYFGVLLIVEKLFLLKTLEKAPSWFRHIYALVFVVFSWMIFAFDDITKVGLYLKAMLGFNHTGILSTDTLYYFSSNILLLVACAVCSVGIWKGIKTPERITTHQGLLHTTKILVFSAMFLVSVCFLIGDTYNPFLYFRF